MDVTENDRQWATLARLVRHPLRSHALFKYAEEVTSPSSIAAALGAPLNVVSYHTNVLLRAGAIELVRTERRRGAAEHFYRAVLAREIGDDAWNALPGKLRRVLVRAVIDGVLRESGDALMRGGMDDPSTHLSRSYLLLDELGRSELASLLRETYTRANAIDRASRQRTRTNAAPYELVMMSFQRASSP
jgi:DNA-binding transcriptional ArsR family regulator